MSLRSRHTDPLGELELFDGATPAEVATARQQLTLLAVDAGTVLIQEGRFGMEFLIIADGHATVEIGGRVVATLGRGDFVGEMSLLGRGPRSATVRAATPLTFYVANASEFSALLDATPSVRERIVRTSSERAEDNRRAALAA